MSGGHLPWLLLSKGLLIAQFKSHKQIMLSHSEEALSNRLYMSDASPLEKNSLAHYELAYSTRSGQCTVDSV